MERLKYLGSLFDLLTSALEVDLRSPESAAEIQRAFGAAMCLKCTERLPRGSPFRFERAEDIPEDLAMSMAVNNEGGFLGDKEMLIPMLTSLPWVARAAPEQLYLPADFLEAIRVPWAPDHTHELLRAYREHYRPGKQEKPEGPTRNWPCPCGTGKKYKRCCGERDSNEGG